MTGDFRLRLVLRLQKVSARTEIGGSDHAKDHPPPLVRHRGQEAAEFYVGTFPDSRVTNVTTIRDTPSGDCDIVSFDLFGQPFQAISAGPIFKFTPAVSFVVA